jgi:zinc transporter ZupT
MSHLSVYHQAYIATLFISLLPNLILFFIPTKVLYASKRATINWQNVLLSFAAAGLLGDVLLHAIPHLVGSHDHHQHGEHEHHEEHGHEHEGHVEEVWFGGLEKSLGVLLTVIIGFTFFFFAEKLANRQLQASEDKKKKNDDATANESKEEANEEKSTENTTLYNAIFELKAVGWLNLFADSMHNFTDGVAIGASFASGGGLAVATFISIICHEIPHEIGDMTILIQNGLRFFIYIEA